jgi:sec-independent protein translocase protein TatC
MPLDQVDVDSWDPDSAGKEMSFFDHIEELRWHILRAVGAVVVVAVGLFIAKDFVFKQVIFGQRNPDFPTYKVLCRLADYTGIKGLCIAPPQFNIETRDLGEVFFQHMAVSFFLGLVMAFPYVFWEFWRFISPGLHIRERRAARGIVFICSMLFGLGVSFGYFVIAPLAISFLSGYTLDGVKVTPTLSSYINYMLMFTLPIGIVFELPVLAYLLTTLGLITPALMKSYRRHMVVILLLISAIITPSPDVMSQLLVWVPLYTLYEVSILVSKRVEKRRALKELKEA